VTGILKNEKARHQAGFFNIQLPPVRLAERLSTPRVSGQILVKNKTTGKPRYFIFVSL
jgi:hypothetical protein